MFVFSVFSSSEQITLSGKQETLQNQMLPKDDVCSLDFLFRLSSPWYYFSSLRLFGWA